MHSRHPRLWLMTDERQGDSLLPALEALPRGAGVIFRHYALAPSDRRALFEQVRRIARRRHLRLLLAAPPALALAWRADGFHGPYRKRSQDQLRSAAIHNRRDAIAALRSGADLLFVSPIFPTRSHPGATTLGISGLGKIIRGLSSRTIRIIALGGMTHQRWRSLKNLGVYGWAGIDALTPTKIRT